MAMPKELYQEYVEELKRVQKFIDEYEEIRKTYLEKYAPEKNKYLDPITESGWINAKRFDQSLKKSGITSEQYFLEKTGLKVAPKCICPDCSNSARYFGPREGYRFGCKDHYKYVGTLKTRVTCGSEEFQQQMRDFAIEKFKDPEQHDILSEACKKKYESEEAHVVTSNAIKKSYENPERGTAYKYGVYGGSVGGVIVRGVRSTMYSEFEDSEIKFDSNWERQFFENWSDNPEVESIIRNLEFSIKWYSKQELELLDKGITINDGRDLTTGHSYRPDFLVTFKSGKKWLVEIKPPMLVFDDSIVDKRKYALEFCRDSDITYVMFCDPNGRLPIVFDDELTISRLSLESLGSDEKLLSEIISSKNAYLDKNS